MFSFGWSEIALTLVIIIIVVGPKEIPNLLRQIGSFSKSIKKISREFKKSLSEIAEEGDIKEIKKSISEVKDLSKDIDPTKEIKSNIDSITDTAQVGYGLSKEEINQLNNDENLLDEENKKNE